MTIKELENLIKIAFYEKTENEFEKLVIQIYKVKYNGEIIPIKPAGQFGDFANDGYILNKLVIQVYAPKKFDYKKAIKKLEENFKRAKEHWEFEEYYFIINDKFEGVHPKVAQKASKLDKEIIFQIIDTQRLQREIINLYKEKPFEIYIIFKKDINIENFDDFERIATIVDFLAEKKEIKNNPLSIFNFSNQLFFQGKEEKIKLNIKDEALYKTFLEIVTQSRKIIPKYKQFFEEKLPEVGEYIKEMYYNFNKNYSPEDSIKLLINSLIEDLKNQDNFDKNIEIATYIIVGYFFDICDIGESPNGNGKQNF